MCTRSLEPKGHFSINKMCPLSAFVRSLKPIGHISINKMCPLTANVHAHFRGNRTNFFQQSVSSNCLVVDSKLT